MAIILDGTLGETFPSWTTAGRPASPVVGQMGYNTTTGLFDMYTASGWVSSLTNASQSIPKSALPTGSVLQVVNALTSGAQSTTSASYSDTNLSATITPTSATSKILVIVNHNGCDKEGGNGQALTQLLRGSTFLSYLEQYGGANGTGDTQNFGGIGLTYLDSPATTSATTYKTQYAVTTGRAYLQQAGGTSSMTLMEIAA